MKKILYCLSALLFATVGCTIDELDMFDKEMVYVEFTDESFETSFLYTPGVDISEFNIEVFMHGMVPTSPVTIAVSVDTASTAIEGTHFEIDKEFTLPAGSSYATIPVTVMRTDDMDEVTYKLVLNIESTDKAIKGEQNQTTLNIDNQVTQPSWWGNTSVVDDNILGKYSKKKYEYFIQATGIISLEDWAYIDMLEAAIVYQKWLDAQDPKVVDEYGKVIELEI